LPQYYKFPKLNTLGWNFLWIYKLVNISLFKQLSFQGYQLKI